MLTPGSHGVKPASSRMTSVAGATRMFRTRDTSGARAAIREIRVCQTANQLLRQLSLLRSPVRPVENRDTST